jgi:antitoxin component YwqK of YwqJK toxin-antitoxin module
MRLAAIVAIALAPHCSYAAAPAYVVTGNCRDGQPHGAYELRMPDGTLRVSGAFARGKRTGSFLFWSSAGVRIAHLPYDDDAMSGTVALWYSTGKPSSEPRQKLEAVYAHGRRAGGARSWYADGHVRAEYRYDQGVLAEARAWNMRGAPLPDAQARAQAERDLAADAEYYASLEAIVRDNPPICEGIGRKS